MPFCLLFPRASPDQACHSERAKHHSAVFCESNPTIGGRAPRGISQRPPRKPPFAKRPKMLCLPQKATATVSPPPGGGRATMWQGELAAVKMTKRQRQSGFHIRRLPPPRRRSPSLPEGGNHTPFLSLIAKASSAAMRRGFGGVPGEIPRGARPPMVGFDSQNTAPWCFTRSE
jgi:hypothetical protein